MMANGPGPEAAKQPQITKLLPPHLTVRITLFLESNGFLFGVLPLDTMPVLYFLHMRLMDRDVNQFQ